jgi:DNA-binding NarL/FixJ family response regulator
MKQPSTDQVRVAVADPSPVVLSGFARILESDDKIAHVGGVANLQLLERLLEREQPHVTIVDWNLLRTDMNRTPYFIRDIRNSTKVLVGGISDSIRDCKLAFELGAKGVLNSRSSSEQICKAVHRLVAGGIWIKKGFADAIVQSTFTEGGTDTSLETRIESLTARERQVVECVCRSMKSKEVADFLQISENTVSHHLSSVFSKLNVKDRVGLVNFAYWNELHVSLTDKTRQAPPLGKSRGLIPRVPVLDRQISS